MNRLTFLFGLIFFLTVSNGCKKDLVIIQGRVLDRATEEPISGAMVDIAPYSDSRPTDVDGRFRFDEVYWRHYYNITVRKTGYEIYRRQLTLREGERIRNETFLLVRIE